MEILPLADHDIPALAPAIAALLRELALEFIVHESSREGASTFLAENDQSGVRKFLAHAALVVHVYHVALEDGQLAGFIAIRDNNHLFHLFVGKRWQGQGLARKLWNVARAAAIARGGDGKGADGNRVGFIRGGARTGATHVTLGYEYALSPRTALHAYITHLDNEENGAYDFAINSLGAAPGATLKGAVLGLRHAF